MADTLYRISGITWILGVAFLVVAVFLWFYFRIPQVFNDLTGRNARRSLQELREKGTAHRKVQRVESKPSVETTADLKGRQETEVLAQSLSGEAMAWTSMEEIFLCPTNETIVPSPGAEKRSSP